MHYFRSSDISLYKKQAALTDIWKISQFTYKLNKLKIIFKFVHKFLEKKQKIESEVNLQLVLVLLGQSLFVFSYLKLNHKFRFDFYINFSCCYYVY